MLPIARDIACRNFIAAISLLYRLSQPRQGGEKLNYRQSDAGAGDSGEKLEVLDCYVCAGAGAVPGGFDGDGDLVELMAAHAGWEGEGESLIDGRTG